MATAYTYEEPEMTKERERLALVGHWFETYFCLKFMPGNLPGPTDALYGSRLRVQIDNKDGDWEDWSREHVKYPQ